jgi:hypothetical protein
MKWLSYAGLLLAAISLMDGSAAATLPSRRVVSVRET